MNAKRNYWILILTYFFIYFSNALFLSFFQIFLDSKGFLESEIGIISAITPLLCIIANPIYSLFGKNNKRVHYLLLFLAIMEAIVILLVYQVSNFSMLIVIMCLVAIIDPPLFIILDSYASSFVKEHNVNYSYIRMVGTLSYAIGTFIAGLLIEFKGYSHVFYSASILMMISVILVLFLKPNYNIEEREKGDIKLLFKNKKFIVFALYFIFILSFQSLGDTYISLFLTNDKKISDSTYGLINSLWVIIELVFILILNKINIKNHNLLLIIMGICYFVRMLVIGLDASLPIVIFGALLRGLAMAIYVCLYIPIITKIIKPSNVPIALLIIGMFKSLLSTIMISLTGFIIESNGYGMIFIIWSIVLLLAILGYYYLSKKYVKIEN